jgi:hypothetical protein
MVDHGPSHVGSYLVIDIDFESLNSFDYFVMIQLGATENNK